MQGPVDRGIFLDCPDLVPLLMTLHCLFLTFSMRPWVKVSVGHHSSHVGANLRFLGVAGCQFSSPPLLVPEASP